MHFAGYFLPPFVHPFRNLFATSIPLRDIAVCKYQCATPPPPFFSPFRPCFFQPFLPSCLLVNHANGYLPPPTYSVSSFESELGRGSCAPERERGRERERDNYRVSQGKICKFVPIRGLVTIVIFHRAYLDRFLTRAFPTFTVTSDREITLT